MVKKTIKTLKHLIERYRLRQRGVTIGSKTHFSHVVFRGRARVEPWCRFVGDPLILIGENFYANSGCHFLGEITIGANVQIGPKTVIWGRDHGIKRSELIRIQPHQKSPIVIEDDVWIGANVTILKGVKVGLGAVIGAGSVVTRDIPNYAIAVGNPARVIRYRE